MKQGTKDPKTTSVSWAEYWDSVWVQKDISKKLQSINKKEQIYFSTTGIINSYVKKYIKKDKEYKILEIGCGGSATFPLLMKSFDNLKISGIDKSLSACKFASEIEKYNDNSIDIVCGDALDPPYKKNSFEIVYSIGLVEHFENQYDIIKTHVDLAKKDGLIVILIPNLVGFQSNLLQSNFFKSEQSMNSDSWINGMKITTPNDLQEILMDLGCQDIKITPAGGLHPLLMLESYDSEEYSKANKFPITFYKIFLSPIFILMNIPFMFKLNVLNLSPFIAATAIKK